MRFIVIGIVYDDADTFHVEVDAADVNDAIKLAQCQINDVDDITLVIDDKLTPHRVINNHVKQS